MFHSFEFVAGKVSNNKIIRSIRRGLLYIMPLILIGSFALMVLNLPIAPFQNAMSRLFGADWKMWLLHVHRSTFSVMSLAALIAVSYAFSEEYEEVQSGEVNRAFIILNAFCSYVAFMRLQDEAIPFARTNSTSLFLALVIAILSTRLFLSFYRHRPIRLKIYAYDADALLLATLRYLVPATLCILLFAGARTALNLSGGAALIETISLNLNQALMQGGTSLLTGFAYIIITHTLWFFGLHGTNILDGVIRSLFLSGSETNIALAQAGLVPTEILTKEFFDVFVYPGGCGATLGLLIALWIGGRKSSVYQIANYSIGPGLFNINDLMVYGLPIIFNPYYLIPFLATPLALTVVTYGAMSLGLVPLTIRRVEWTTPIIISGYVSTGSAAGILLQLANLALSALIYLPFVRMYEKDFRHRHKQVFQALNDEIGRAAQLSLGHSLLARNDDVGTTARNLASELGETFRGERQTLSLEFQPQVNAAGEVLGAEALLRWNHPVYGYISPLVTLSICDEAKLTNQLGGWVFQHAFQELRHWHDMGCGWLCLSANLSPKQLREDDNLVRDIRRLIQKTGIDAAFMELELTEDAAVDQSLSTRDKLEAIKTTGISIAIDDFGMGNSSLLYLRDFYASIVKIDISLVRRITSDIHSQEIVRSIFRLCDQLKVGVVAEGVETREQMEMLRDMGCGRFQGFYFSKSLPREAFLRYVEEHGMARETV